MKPLGFYVSVPEGHTECEALAKIEDLYGSHFENVSDRELWVMLWWCSVCIPKSLTSFTFSSKPITELSTQTCFNLIPFLHQVIKERLVKDATN